jgi:hypothetical protein
LKLLQIFSNWFFFHKLKKVFRPLSYCHILKKFFEMFFFVLNYKNKFFQTVFFCSKLDSNRFSTNRHCDSDRRLGKDPNILSSAKVEDNCCPNIWKIVICKLSIFIGILIVMRLKHLEIFRLWSDILIGTLCVSNKVFNCTGLDL